MTQLCAPQPLHILLAWPEAPARALRRALLEAALPIEITPIRATALSQYLAEPDYYHVLYITPADWQALTPPTRQHLAARVSLIVFGPEPATEIDATELLAGLYMRDARSLDDVLALLLDVHRQLANGQPVTRSLMHSQHTLTFVGAEACWPDSSLDSAASSVTANVVNRSGGVDVNGEIGTVNVAGDVVGRDKIVYHADGDQIIRASANAAKIVQQAGGDQINVNRVTDAAPEITQTAQGDQVNRNTISSTPAARTCAHCGQGVGAQDRFCMSCGKEL